MHKNQRKSLDRFKPFQKTSNQNKFICHQCDLSIETRHFDEHIIYCKQRPTRCQYCDQEYPKSLIEDHEELCSCREDMKQLLIIPHQPVIQQRSILQQGERFEEQKFQNQIQNRENITNQIQQWNSYDSDDYQMEQNPNLRQRNLSFSGSFRNDEPSEYREQIMQFVQQQSEIVQQLPQKEIDRIPVQTYLKNSNLSSSAKYCSICQSEFEQGEKIRMLGCTHRFHSDCIIGWLNQKQICPNCKRNAFEGLE